MKTQYVKYAALLASLTLAAACSKDNGDDAAAAQAAADSAAAVEAAAAPMPTELDACNLLTAAEAQAIVGKAVAGPTRNESTGQCEYKVEGGMAGTFTIQTQMVYAANAADETAAQLKAGGATTTDAPGIGDKSFFVTQQSITQLYTFHAGNQIVMALGYMGSDAQQRQLASKLMTKALEKAAAPAAPQQPAPQQ